MNTDKKTGVNRLLVPVLLLITAAAVAVAVWAVFFRQDRPMLAPDQAPQEEESAQAIPGDEEEPAESPEGGGSVTLTYSKEVTVSLGEETAALYFANPGRSNQDMVLQVLVRDTVIVQSGTLKPGNQVETLPLLDGAAEMLSAGSYEGTFSVLYYDPETGEKAMVDTEIPITITVNA